MDRVIAPAPVLLPFLFEDGFGRRTGSVDPETSDEIEQLELSAGLVEHDGFVAALSERVARVANVRHASYVRVRRLDRPAPHRLVLVSDHAPGWRLSELLRMAAERQIPIDTTVVIGLLRQVLPAVALFGRNNRESAIGTLAPERLVLTPQARLVIAEHAFGPAIEKLHVGRDRLWHDFRVAMPPAAGHPRADARADANALGVVALSLLMGRVLAEDEYPAKLQALVEVARERREGETVPLSQALEQWLLRALQLDVRAAFQSPHEAQVAFETVLASDRSYVTTPAALEAFVRRVGAPIAHAQEPRSDLSAPGASATGPLAQAPAPSVVSAPTPPASESPAPAAPTETVDPATPASEGRETPVVPEAPPPRSVPVTRSSLAITLAALAMLQSGVLIWLWNHPPAAPFSGVGELVVQSRPASARVTIDGEDRGLTPLTVRLPAGAHVLEIRVGASEPRVIPITIQTGVQTAQYIELQSVPMTGGLDLRSDPPGARVTVDGQRRGVTPLKLTDLPPGEHAILLDAPRGTVKQVVRIDAGVTSQVTVRMPGK